MSEMLDPSPTVIWFPSLVQSQAEAEMTSGSSQADERRKPRRVAVTRAHVTRNDRSRRAEDERARLIRLIG